METAHREEGRGAVIVVLATRALGSERADHVGPDLADEVHDVGGDAICGRAREAAVGPLEEAGVLEPDDAHGLAPLLAALGGELRRCPRPALFPEPHAHVAARKREERRRVPGGSELHRRAGDAERFVVGMRVHEEDGADGVTLA